ncbi:chorismate mutase [Shewanella sp. PP-He15 brown]
MFALLSLPALADTDENAELYANMNTRLSYMQQVALYKWQHQLPIEDLAREKIVLAQSVTAAESLGITSAAITDFFQVQIELAKKFKDSTTSNGVNMAYPKHCKRSKTLNLV